MSICVICKTKLKVSPTKRWWIKLSYDTGICYDCILHLSSTVLKMMEHDYSKEKTKQE